jgi:rSAM/selenodomain-associated transferase 1
MAMSQDNPDSVAVAIFAKAPIIGTVKTRLALMLGVDGATTLHERLARATVEKAVSAGIGPVRLWCSPDERHAFFQGLSAEFPVSLLRQPSGDHGARLLAALLHAQGPTIILGSDCPALTVDHLRAAADVLRTEADAVVCPSDDGGYALLGLRAPQPELFSGMVWDNDSVMTETRLRLTRLGLSWREPAQLWTVDRPSDVRRMRREGMDELLTGIGRAQTTSEIPGFPWVPPHARQSA